MTQNTDVSPEVDAIKKTGGKAQGESAMAQEAAGHAKATRMVKVKGTSAGKVINKQSGGAVPGVTPETQPHTQAFGK